MFDIFLACAPKDFNKLPYVVDAAVKNIKDYDNIIICSPIEIPPEILSRIPAMHYTYNDDTGLPGVSRDLWKYRPNWGFQQHLKLFQKLTQDWYLTLDCDTIINRSIEFFEEGKPIYWKGGDQIHPPYFVFQERMLGFPKIKSTSFIADMNFIHRPIIEDMLKRNNYTIGSFIAKSQEINSKECHIGEPELYGNYCFKYFPDLYIEKNLVQAPFEGRLQKDMNKLVWSDEEIKTKIKKMKEQEFDTFALHSWYLERE